MERNQLASNIAFLVVLLLVSTTCFLCIPTANSQGLGITQDEQDFLIGSRKARYFDHPHTARSLGMGRSTRSTTGNVTSLFGNPAGLGWITGPELALTYSHDEISGKEQVPMQDEFLLAADGFNDEDIDEEFDYTGLQLACPAWAGSGILSVGGYYDESETSGLLNTHSHRYRLAAGYAIPINACWTAGYALSYFNDEVHNDFSDYDMDNGFRHSFGLQYHPCSTVAFGVHGFFADGDTDLDSDDATFIVEGADEGDLESWGIETGLEWSCRPTTVVALAFDYTEYEFDGGKYVPMGGANASEIRSYEEDIDTWGLHVGVEEKINECLFARVGYRYEENDFESTERGRFFGSVIPEMRDLDSDYHAVSGGLGFLWKENLTLDYGIEYRWVGDGDLTNTVTARFHF